MDEVKRFKQVINDLENKLQNSHKCNDVAWNNAIIAAMEQFGVEHKPPCVKSRCSSCEARNTLKPLLRDGNLNRKPPREIIGDFLGLSMAQSKFVGKEHKAYIQGMRDLFDELIRKGIV